MPDYTPKSNSAEWHITYECDLACIACSRMCMAPPAAPDMTIDDAAIFVQQCLEIGWKPDILILGGEPTMHKDFFAFIHIANTLGSAVVVYSNQYSKEAKKKCKQVEDEKIAVVHHLSAKPKGSVTFTDNIALSPKDFGIENAPPCFVHTAFSGENRPPGLAVTLPNGESFVPVCGISVDSLGYTLCPVGGTIDSFLDINIRTKELKDLFDENFALKHTCDMCGVCGFAYQSRTGQSNWHKHESVKKYRGTHLSPTWKKAVDRHVEEHKKKSEEKDA